MKITTIERGSPAWLELAAAFADPNTYAVHITVDAYQGTAEQIAVKANGGMWSPPLNLEVTRRPFRAPVA